MLNVVQGGKQLSLDTNGNLNINLAAGSISGGNAAASTTGSAVPASADYLGVNIAGNLVGVTGISLTNAKAATVAIVDGSGNQITSFGGGTQYAQGTTQSSPTGTVAMAKNASNVLNALALDGSGYLYVNVAAGSSGNSAASATGSTVPSSAGYTGYNSGGNLVGVSTSNPLPVAQQGSVAVTGTFYQATQPVSLTSTTITGSVAVTGAFYQTTQPVSLSTLPALVAGSANIGGVEIIDSGGTNKLAVNASGQIAISNFPASQAVTGTFWQTTQPVSGTFYQATQPVSIASMPTTPVTGTFWQTTQPVSLTSTTITGTVAVSGTVAATQSGTWTVQQGSAPWSDNLTQVNSVALGSPSAFGTSPGSVNVLGTNASLFAGSTGLVADASGNLKVNINAVGFAGVLVTQDSADASTGSALPAVATLTGGANGGILRYLSVDSLGKETTAENGGQSDILTNLLLETRAMKSAIIAFVTESGRFTATDFEAKSYDDAYVSEVVTA